MAKLSGFPDYPFAVVAHPIGGLDEAGLQTRAVDAGPQVIASFLVQS